MRRENGFQVYPHLKASPPVALSEITPGIDDVIPEM